MVSATAYANQIEYIGWSESAGDNQFRLKSVASGDLAPIAHFLYDVYG